MGKNTFNAHVSPLATAAPNRHNALSQYTALHAHSRLAGMERAVGFQSSNADLSTGVYPSLASRARFPAYFARPVRARELHVLTHRAILSARRRRPFMLRRLYLAWRLFIRLDYSWRMAWYKAARTN